MASRFRDRSEAGQALARLLTHYADRPDVQVLALPRGGVPVGFEVARALHAPLDVLLVRKLGLPGQEELAMGAVATGGRIVLNEEVLYQVNLPREVIDQAIDRELRELKQREKRYRGERPVPDVLDQVVILVDDGLATGSSMRAAAEALRLQQPQRIVVAVPVAPVSTCEALRAEVDEVVCVATPEPFYAVGMWYDDFAQVTDEEVRDLLERASAFHPIGAGPGRP